MLRQLFVTTPAGAADLAAQELRDTGVTVLREVRAGVECAATLEQAYELCLWSRVATRILLPLATFAAATPEALYEGARGVDWSRHLTADGTLAVDCTIRASALTHTQFAALKLKDAIVDQFRERTGRRPSVDVTSPDLRVNLHIDRDVATVAIDLAGDSLHRRGYRGPQGAAPLKENLAAAVLLRAGWPAVAAAGNAGFVDPMCGSGTLAIEAALIAHDVAPGLLRTRFGFERWRGHDAALWERVRQRALERRKAGRRADLPILGFDRDAAQVHAAQANAERAGLRDLVTVAQRALDDLPPAPAKTGLVAVNPPYGARLGEERELAPLYALLGAKLREGFEGWQAAVLTGNPPLGRELGIKAKRTHTLMNGPIECRLLRLDVAPASYETRAEPGRLRAPADSTVAARPGAVMFANRLRKNAAQAARWARDEGVTCYRVYDADMPEYAFSIDVYASFDGVRRFAYVQEYAAPPSVDQDKARGRRAEAFAVIPEVLEIPPSAAHVRTRRRQKGGAQYGKVAAVGEFHTVAEGGLRFLVNFTDYLDTGLFLDHRPIRARLRGLAAGKHFLNLFAYTGTASVYAAAGGAKTTTTVDLSATYLDWARRNLEANGFRDPRRHRLLQEDVVAWLESPARERYELVFLDPPTVSRSKRMRRELDIQRDHVALITAAMRRVTPEGLLVFSNNFRKFKLDRTALADFDVRDVTGDTIPRDFARNPKIHHCFEIRARG